MISISKCITTLFAPALVAGLLMGGARASQAQILFNNTTLLQAATPTATPTLTNTVTKTYGTGDSYYISAAGNTDNSSKDGSSIGADIRLSISPDGIKLTSNQNATLNSSSDIYTFYTTITDLASSQAGVLTTEVLVTTQFNEGSSSTSATLIGFGSLQGGVLGGNSLVLGSHTYSATILDFTPPSAPPNGGGVSSTGGAFSEHIDASSVPEPGSIATLLGLGITGSAFVLRRKR